MKTKALIMVVITILCGCMACKKKSEEKILNTASCKIDGALISFTSESAFNKICLFSTYCNGFTPNPDVSYPLLYIGFPSTVATGTVYDPSVTHFSVTYLDQTGYKYHTTAGHSFTLTVTLWGGNGNRTTGTFSGVLYSAEGIADSVVIENGKYDSKIWYITTQ